MQTEKKTRTTRIMMSLKEPKIIRFQLSIHQQKKISYLAKLLRQPIFLDFFFSLTHSVNHFHVQCADFPSLSFSQSHTCSFCLYDIIQAGRKRKMWQQKITTIDMQSTLMCTHMQINQILYQKRLHSIHTYIYWTSLFIVYLRMK